MTQRWRGPRPQLLEGGACRQGQWQRRCQPWWAQWVWQLLGIARTHVLSRARSLTVLCAQLSLCGTSSADGMSNASSSTAWRRRNDLRVHATASARDRGTRASGLNEAGRDAHLQRRHLIAADEAPGRPMRGDDRCGRSDPHIGWNRLVPWSAAFQPTPTEKLCIDYLKPKTIDLQWRTRLDGRRQWVIAPIRRERQAARAFCNLTSPAARSSAQSRPSRK